MSLELGAQRLGVFQSPVQRGDFRTGAGDLVLEHAQALGFTDLTGRSLGEPDAGLIGFGARLVERAAQLLEPALEQQGPVRAPPGWRASKRGRYAFSQGKRTIRHYSEMGELAKPGGLLFGKRALRPLVLLVAHLLQPVDAFAALSLVNGDVRQRGGGRRAMPMLLSGRNPHDVPGPDLLN